MGWNDISCLVISKKKFMKTKSILVFAFLISLFGIDISRSQNNKIIVGADLLLSEKIGLIENKRLGIVTNHTAILSNGSHLVDELLTKDRIVITALFGPEHGIRGAAPAGIKIDHSVDSKTNLPVYSLYGKEKKPTKEMLKNVDLLIFDIQDIGARFYTYISTLFYTIQAAAENNIPVIVLDRPNPIGGIRVEGPITKKDYESFVGIAPIPIQHGMTVGELAKYFVGEKLIGNNLKSELTIIEIKNWGRKLFFDETQLKWINPSPNIQSLEAAIVYPGTCLLEGTNISEGRGTDSPFLMFGAPFINSNELLLELKRRNIIGINFSEVIFTPISIEGIAKNPKYENTKCYGIKISVTDRYNFNAVKFGVELISALHKLYPTEFKFREKSFDLLTGDSEIRKMIAENKPVEKIFDYWKNDLETFIVRQKNYLLY
ncbi:MAG: DUF1343 domain-containing protein [Chlorobiaceae bacterium]|nr:DUF1343 domain-containing protein [Chlorobiaceae bacterium]MBA4310428.1 DUF1343 domain-containing protein [Chlorobiaceae bacterium]